MQPYKTNTIHAHVHSILSSYYAFRTHAPSSIVYLLPTSIIDGELQYINISHEGPKAVQIFFILLSVVYSVKLQLSII